MKHEGEHAYYAGYVGNRAVRTWREHMHRLEANGFIKTSGSGNQQYKYVLLIHPTTVVEVLRVQGKIDPHWLRTYESRQLEPKERTFAERMKARKAKSKVVPLKPAKSVGKVSA